MNYSKIFLNLMAMVIRRGKGELDCTLPKQKREALKLPFSLLLVKKPITLQPELLPEALIRKNGF